MPHKARPRLVDTREEKLKPSSCCEKNFLYLIKQDIIFCRNDCTISLSEFRWCSISLLLSFRRSPPDGDEATSDEDEAVDLGPTSSSSLDVGAETNFFIFKRKKFLSNWWCGAQPKIELTSSDVFFGYCKCDPLERLAWIWDGRTWNGRFSPPPPPVIPFVCHSKKYPPSHSSHSFFHFLSLSFPTLGCSSDDGGSSPMFKKRNENLEIKLPMNYR